MVNLHLLHKDILRLGALLHYVAVAVHKTCAKRRMRLHSDGQCFLKPRQVGVGFDFYGLRHIVLQCLAVALPVDEHTALVLGDRIVFTFPDGSGRSLLCGRGILYGLYETAHGRIGHSVFRSDTHVEPLGDCGHQTHGQQGGQPHLQQVGGHAERIMTKHIGHNARDLPLLGSGGLHNLLVHLDLRHGECLAVDLAVLVHRKPVKFHHGRRNHEFGEVSRHEGA